MGAVVRLRSSLVLPSYRAENTSIASALATSSLASTEHCGHRHIVRVQVEPGNARLSGLECRQALQIEVLHLAHVDKPCLASRKRICPSQQEQVPTG